MKSESILLTIIKLVKIPNSNRNQQVSFLGREGIIRNFKYKNRIWKYLVEILLAPVMPEFGKIGAEIIVLLNEVELDTIGN